MTIQYLSPTDENDHGRIIYKYEDQTYEIDDDYITEYIGSTDESDVGFIKVDDGFVRYESDSDYVPSEESDSGTDEEYEDEPDYSLDEE